MAVSLRVEPVSLDRDLTEMLKEIVSPEARSSIIADVAREAIAEADAINLAALGRVPGRVITVDGRAGINLDQVKPDGSVQAEYRLIDDLLWWIAEQLEEHSPVGDAGDKRPGHPGLYRASHVLIADGRAVAIHRGEMIPDAEDYAFVSVVPYARKIERGMSSQAPEGVYQTVATLARGRFGNLAKISFGYRAPEFGAISRWARIASARRLAKGTRGGNHALHDEWLRRQPAVIVEPR